MKINGLNSVTASSTNIPNN